jgi:HPt (histidine-containing phosphotransfer) domain-containing protein
MSLYDAGSDKLKIETLDSVALWERVNQDTELLRDLVDLFEQQCPVLLNDIESAIGKGSCVDLQKVSHKLKGSLLQFSAQRAAPIASELEAMGKNGKMEGAEEAFAELKAEVARILPALKAMIQGGKPVF